MRGRAEKSGKEVRRGHSEQRAGPRRGQSQAAGVSLHGREAEEGGEGFWDTVECDGRPLDGRSTRIASQAFLPREARMGALGTRQDCRLAGFERLCRSDFLHIHPLRVQELHTGSSMLSATPIPPEQGSRANTAWMQQDAHSARVLGGPAVPLTLFAQLTGATHSDASLIDDAQAPSSFPASFLGKQARSSRTAQRVICLESKVLPREAVCFPGQGPFRWAIATGCSRSMSRFLVSLRPGGSKRETVRSAEGSS